MDQRQSVWITLLTVLAAAWFALCVLNGAEVSEDRVGLPHGILRIHQPQLT